MSKLGVSCLSDAHEYFNMCYVAGLLPRNFDLSKERSVSTVFLPFSFQMWQFFGLVLFFFAGIVLILKMTIVVGYISIA